jgi:hypothetical protein
MSGGHWNDHPGDYTSNGDPNYLHANARYELDPHSPARGQPQAMEERGLVRPIAMRMGNDANSLLSGLAGGHGGATSWNGPETPSAAPMMSRQPSVPEPGMRGSAFGPPAMHSHESPQHDAVLGSGREWGGYPQAHPQANPGTPIMADALTQLMTGLGANRGMQGTVPASWPATQSHQAPGYAPTLPGSGRGEYGQENTGRHAQVPGYLAPFPSGNPTSHPGGTPPQGDPNLITVDRRALQNLVAPEQLAALAASGSGAQLPQAPPQPANPFYAAIAAAATLMGQANPVPRAPAYVPPAPVMDTNHAIAGFHALINSLQGVPPAAQLPQPGMGNQGGYGMNLAQSEAGASGGRPGWPQGVNGLQYPAGPGPRSPDYHGQVRGRPKHTWHTLV